MLVRVYSFSVIEKLEKKYFIGFSVKREKDKKSEAIHELKSWQEAPFLCCNTINSNMRLLTVKLEQSFMIRELIMIILWVGPFSTEELSLFLYTFFYTTHPWEKGQPNQSLKSNPIDHN